MAKDDLRDYLDSDANVSWRVRDAREARRQKQSQNAELLWLIFWGLLAFTAVVAIVSMSL